MSRIILKAGREKSIRLRHPWIFSGSIQRVEGDPVPGETVSVCAQSGEFLGRAAYSPASQIRARLWTTREDELVGADFFRRRIQDAIRYRNEVVPPGETDAYRLVHAESDGLPGLIVDRYPGLLVTQILSAGAEAWKEVLVEILAEETGLDQVYERSDVDVRRLEGLPERVGPLRGAEPPERAEICENGLRFLVDVKRGHKTGFYLDQRANRTRLVPWAAGKSVLNCFSYTGGFTLAALRGGARTVLSVDTSTDALALAAENVRLNGFPGDRAAWLEGDVFHVLRSFRDQARSFDLIVLDPPRFAPTSAQAERAARGYKDINLLALKLLNPGGTLFTFSCSGGISPELFQKIVAGAAQDAGVDARIVAHLEQGPDHPVLLSFPEGAYLKGLICQKE
ncbi:MAG TPA: class I SAM-dependent rRNA methyltransferase [Anaerolineaceae bacterium]|nr:class I SAM-dependent rRNA methyltransferase [Anaerolineaceae bacterium]